MVAIDDNQQEVKTFKQTCDKPYLRHHYKLVYGSGKEVVFGNYMDIQATWIQTPSQFLSHIEVLDIGKGFK